MKWVLGVKLLLLMLVNQTTPFDKTWITATPTITLHRTSVTADSSMHRAAMTILSAMTSVYGSATDEPAPAVGEASHRSPNAIEAETEDHDGETDDTPSGEGGPLPASNNAPVLECAAEYEPIDYHDEIEAPSGTGGPPPGSNNAPVLECAAEYEPIDYYDEIEAPSGAGGPPPGSNNAPVLECAAEYEPIDYYDEIEAAPSGAGGPPPASTNAPVPEVEAEYEPLDYDYDEETGEAPHGGGGPPPASNNAPVPEGGEEYEPADYYCDDETGEAQSGEGGPVLASHDVQASEGASTVDRRQTDSDTSRGKRAVASGSTAVSRREELGAGAAAVATGGHSQSSNWLSWLPSWCWKWPINGALHVSRETLLRAFSEALEQHIIEIDNYWAQPAQSADNDEQHSDEKPNTHLMSIAVRQSEMLLDFYQWMFQKLTASEVFGECRPESVYRFLDALERQANMVESICNWSPTTRLTCNAGNSSIYRNFFWAIDRLSMWMDMFTNWAISQCNVGERPSRHLRWRLPINLDERTRTFNTAQNFSETNQTARHNQSVVELIGDGVRSVEERAVQRDEEIVRNDLLSEETTDLDSCPVKPKFDPRKKPHHLSKYPTCLLQSLSVQGHESGKLRGTERDTESEATDEYEAVSAAAPPLNGMDPFGEDGTFEENLDLSFYESFPQTVLRLEERTRESSVVEVEGEEEEQVCRPDQVVPESRKRPTCTETNVMHVLGQDFYPYMLVYVTCNEQEDACDPPEKCLPFSALQAIEMPRWAKLPEFPYKLLRVRELPNGRLSATLLVPKSCMCLEPYHEK